MQFTVVIAVFTDSYRSYLSQLQIVAKRLNSEVRSLRTILSTRDTISIHNDYVSKSSIYNNFTRI